MDQARWERRAVSVARYAYLTFSIVTYHSRGKTYVTCRLARPRSLTFRLVPGHRPVPKVAATVLYCHNLCESRSSSLTVWGRGEAEKGRSVPQTYPNYCRDATMSCLDRKIETQHVGRKREALLDRKPGCVSEARSEACSRRVGGNLPERGAFGPAPLSSIHYLGSGGWVKRNGRLNA